MVEMTQVFNPLFSLRTLYGPDFKFESRLTICVRSQSHQFLCNASVDVREVCVASQACDGFMQQGPAGKRESKGHAKIKGFTVAL